MPQWRWQALIGDPVAWAQANASSPPQALDLVDNAAFFGDSFEAGNNGNTFADRFTVAGTVGQNLDAIGVSVSRTAGVGLDITGFWLFDGNDTLPSEGTSLESGATDVWTAHGGNLSAGTVTCA